MTAVVRGGDGIASNPTQPTIDTPLPTPGMGWSTYNFFGPQYNAVLLEQMGDAFVASGLRDAGYQFIRIDGGWWGDDGQKREWYWTQEGEYPGGMAYHNGDPHADPKNYPNGIKALAEALHLKQMKLDDRG